MSDETTRLHLAQLVSLQELNAVTWNEALAGIDALVDLYLLGQFVNDPPPSPQDGDAYLIGGAPTGAWNGYTYKIASCLDGAWRFYAPFNGLRAYVAPSGEMIVYLNGVWTAIGSTDFASKSGSETLTNKTLGETVLPGGGIMLSTGYLGIGTNVPSYALEVAGNASVWGYRNSIYSDAAGTSPGFVTRRARGTMVAPGAVQSGDALFGLFAGGYKSDGSFSGNIAAFAGYAEENFTASACGTRISFATTAIGTVVRTIRLTIDNQGNIVPGADNTQNLGSAGTRFATVFAGTGTINTSAAATKTNVRALSEAETAVARGLATNIRIFQFCDAAAKKGDAAARLHCGMIYEEVVAGFAAQGLDPLRYGIVCRDPALKAKVVTDDDGNVRTEFVPDRDETGMQKWTCGLRYSELAQFILAGLSARLAALEGRLA